MLYLRTDSRTGLYNLNIMAFTAENHSNPADFDIPAGSLSAALVEASAPFTPNTIFHVGDTVAVKIDWTQIGTDPQFNMLNPGCYYEAKAYIERMGPGIDPPVVASAQVPVVQGNVSYAYPTLQFNLPAALTASPGVHKVTVTFNFYNATGTYTKWHSYDELAFVEVVL